VARTGRNRQHAELEGDFETQRGLFFWTHDREPENVYELTQFIETLIREQYNQGHDTVQYPWA
jgi:hypothetical protein